MVLTDFEIFHHSQFTILTSCATFAVPPREKGLMGMLWNKANMADDLKVEFMLKIMANLSHKCDMIIPLILWAGVLVPPLIINLFQEFPNLVLDIVVLGYPI